MHIPRPLRCAARDDSGHRCDYVRFHRGRHLARWASGCSSSWARATRETYEVDAPWITWTWLSTDRETRFTGRMRMRLTCCVCGARETIRIKIPRFGPVPEPEGGRHAVRLDAIERHAHPERGHPMSWAIPLRNMAAHRGGLNLDLLGARLEADLNEDPPA